MSDHQASPRLPPHRVAGGFLVLHATMHHMTADNPFDDASQRAAWQTMLSGQMQIVSDQYETLRGEIEQRSGEVASKVAEITQEYDEIALLEAKRQMLWKELHSYMSGVAGPDIADRMYPPQDDDD